MTSLLTWPPGGAVTGDYRFAGDARPRGEVIGWEDFQGQFEAAVRGALNTIQATVPDMAAAKFGRIINIGTNLFQNPVVPYHDYTAAKAALPNVTYATLKVSVAPAADVTVPQPLVPILTTPAGTTPTAPGTPDERPNKTRKAPTPSAK